MSYLTTDQELSRDSYYTASATRSQSFAPFDGDSECDVAIVGGGMAGLSAAIELADKGFKVTVLEAREVGSGASGRNGGQAIHGLACDQQTIERQLGLADARHVWDATLEALDLIQQRCTGFGIDCEWRNGYLGVAVNEAKARELQAAADHLERHYDFAMSRIPRDEIGRWISSPRYVSGVHDPRSGHLHPLKYTLGLARAASSLGVTIHEQSPVIELITGPTPALRTARGVLKARQVLLAGNVYLQGVAPPLARRIMPVGTYIIASEPLPAGVAESLIPSGSAVCDNNFVLDYFRPSRDGRMIFGGRASYATRTPSHLAESMRQRMLAVFPQLSGVKVAHAWGGFVDVTMNRAPDFGRLPLSASTGSSNVYYLQGFSGHGVALTGIAGKLIAEAMAGDASRFDTFARLTHRPFPGGPLRMPALVLGMAWYRLRDALAR